MKRTLPVVAAFFVALALSQWALTFAQEETPPGPPKVKDYKEAVVNLTKWSENVNKPEYYKDVELENIKTGKVLKLKDLPQMEQDVFYLYQAEILTKRLAGLAAAWDKELAVAPVRDKDAKKEDLEKTDRLPDKTDIEESSAKLLELRKQHAVRFEKIMDETFKKYEKEIPANDAKLYRQKITEFHDRQKLIERKKDSK